MCVSSGAHSAADDHLVLFYGRDEELATAAGQFCSDGLGAGDAVLVVATGPHRRAIRSTVLADHQSLARVGELEAASTLQRLIGASGHVERSRFLEVMQPTLATVAQSAESGRVRIYGEMVALLTDAGDPDGAIALEELWNELAEGPVPFSLLCGYPQWQADADGREPWVERVHQVHTGVLAGNAS